MSIASAEVATVVRSDFLEFVANLENFVWLLNRMPTGRAPELHRSSQTTEYRDELLVQRVMSGYRRAIAKYASTDGFWDVWHLGLKKPIHDALSGDEFHLAARALRDPASSAFFWGFDAIASSPEGQTEPHQLVIARLNTSLEWHEIYALWLCDALVSLSEAIGARRANYPEIEIDQTLAARFAEFDVDSVIDEIEKELAVRLSFPNPYPNELGLKTKRGIVGFRSIQSVYQAWRIAQLARGNPDFKVMEIGAGLGRTAYFAYCLGVKNYTLVDLPISNAAQGYFLGRTLGEENIQLCGEGLNAKLRIMVNTEIESHDEKYDLIVNVDSLTEMPQNVATGYWSFAREATGTFLSINHEFNSFTVRDLYKVDKSNFALRYPYPLRRGYVEELITWD